MTTREPGASEVLTRGETRQPALDGLLRQQPGRQHDARVGGVGARGDRGDEHVAVPRPRRGRDPSEACRAVGRRAVVRHLRFGPHVGVASERAAHAGRRLARRRPDTADRPSVAGKRSASAAAGFAVAVLGDRPGEELPETRLQVGQIDPVLRPLRAGHARRARSRGRARAPRCSRTRPAAGCRTAPGPCSRPRNASTCSAVRPVASRYRHDSSSTGKKPIVAPYSGAMLRDGRAVGDGQRRRPFAEELDELADDLGLAQHLGHDAARGRWP